MRLPIPIQNVPKHNGKGFATVEFLLCMALLFFPISLLVLTFASWFETSIMTSVAAREGARTYVLERDQAKARAAIDDVVGHYSTSSDDVKVTLEGDPNTPGSDVVVDVSTEIKTLHFAALKIDIPGFTIRTTHAEPVDLYRSAAKQ